ncbi:MULTISPECIES: helix-turn-helix domain-containing protein [Caproicibacterium]|uniref:Helix-turn-helix transcriptional regulator n=1 Tax=Caproicibacterium argilliputei TaxID=3030016 RepID=A0AA97DC67_9FIRM|nr:helix-turn-helix transcriptional regulator [Caproicibacterium argilliputei]WOC33022.1 helix-turn-helix transcriptional regulator [Caproicibacterium argilliputei]
MFIDVLTELCSHAGISAYKLSEQIGLNRSAVAKWKKGATPNGATLNKIADYFDVSIDYLLGDRETKSPTSDSGSGTEDMALDDFTYAFLDESKELTEENKQKLLEMAKFFKMQQDKEKKNSED